MTPPPPKSSPDFTFPAPSFLGVPIKTNHLQITIVAPKDKMCNIESVIPGKNLLDEKREKVYLEITVKSYPVLRFFGTQQRTYVHEQ